MSGSANIYATNFVGNTSGGGIVASSLGGTGLNNGANTLTVNANSTINQDVSSNAAPTFTSLILSNTTTQILLGTGTTRTTLSAPAPAANVTLTLPNTADTLIGRATTDTLSNKTLVAPVLGTPASGNLVNCTGYPLANVTGILSATNGGTGINNGANTLTLVNPTTLTTTGPTNVTLPTSGTLIAFKTTPTYSSYLTTTNVIVGSTSGNATLSSLTYRYFTDPSSGMITFFLDAVWSSHNIVGNVNINLTPLALASGFTWPLLIGRATGLGINSTGSLYSTAISTTVARIFVNVSGVEVTLTGTDMSSTGELVLTGTLS